jgi:hypothetical protein
MAQSHGRKSTPKRKTSPAAKSKAKQARQAKPPEPTDMASWRPGSDPVPAGDVGASGDFGVPAGAGPDRERDYVNENTKAADPGATQPMAWEHDGVRDHGAGARDSGPGSSSAGDVDPDIVGVGTGGGVAASGPGARPGPDDSDGTSNEFNSPVPQSRSKNVVIEPASGRNQTGVHKVGGSKRVRGTVAPGPDRTTVDDPEGADAATNPPARGDDSFAGEVSSGEASGQDLGVSPSSDTQGLTPGDNQTDTGAPGRKDFPDTEDSDPAP